MSAVTPAPDDGRVAPTLGEAAESGLDDTVTALLHISPPPGYDEIDFAFWRACRGGHLGTAQILFRHGAQLNRRPPWVEETPLDAAAAAEAGELAHWLRTLGGATAAGLRY